MKKVGPLKTPSSIRQKGVPEFRVGRCLCCVAKIMHIMTKRWRQGCNATSPTICRYQVGRCRWIWERMLKPRAHLTLPVDSTITYLFIGTTAKTVRSTLQRNVIDHNLLYPFHAKNDMPQELHHPPRRSIAKLRIDNPLAEPDIILQRALLNLLS
jgi:hypothetical protein